MQPSLDPGGRTGRHRRELGGKRAFHVFTSWSDPRRCGRRGSSLCHHTFVMVGTTMASLAVLCSGVSSSPGRTPPSQPCRRFSVLRRSVTTRLRPRIGCREYGGRRGGGGGLM